MHISKIEIENFRSYSKSEITLDEGLNVIVGANNSGKSNLLKVINYLYKDPNLDASIHDFNKNILFDKIQEFKEIPPEIKIIYTIEHYLVEDSEDSAISKLAPLSIFEQDGNLIEENGRYHLIVKIELRYELDSKYVDNYKSLLGEDIDYKKLIDALKKEQDYFHWQFYNYNNKDIIERKVVSNIFDIDFIDATRLVGTLTDNSRKYVKHMLKDLDIDEFDIKQGVTSTLKESLNIVTERINDEIEEDQDNIGIIDGKNRFISSFEYNGNISDWFRYELEDNTKNYSLPLDYNGLGYNNLIYMRNLIKQKKDNDYNILLLEEPEAHLHPNMQYKLIKYIYSLQEQDRGDGEKKIKNQIIITTHSANITASCELENMILLNLDRGKSIPQLNAVRLSDNYEYEKVFHKLNVNKNEGESEIDYNKRLEKIKEELDSGKKHLRRFLDVTRCDMLFSDKIILVEGLAEKLLIPQMDKDLIGKHVAIVELGGINFNYFLPICYNTGRKILCVTDRDIDIIQEENNKLKLLEVEEFFEENNHIDLNLINDKIKIQKQQKFGSTFEKELFLENYENNDNFLLLIKFALKNCNEIPTEKTIKYWLEKIDDVDMHGKTKTYISDKLKKYKKLYDDQITIEKKNLVEKMFFTNLFYHYVQNRKGELALFLTEKFERDELVVPNYIKEGLEWLKR